MQDKKPFKAYDAAGEEYGYKTAIDQHHACTIAGYSLTRPGEAMPAKANPMRQYDKMSADDLRKLCIAKEIKGYTLLNRELQIEALLESDKIKPAPVATVTMPEAPAEPVETVSVASEPVDNETAAERKNRKAREARAKAKVA